MHTEMKTSPTNLNKFLYLIPFQDNKHFKIGISSFNNFRILNHNKNFKIDYSNSIIYTAEKQSILDIIEKELLIIFPQCEHPYQGVDGSTEVRELKYLDESIAIINSKPSILGIKRHKYNDVFKQKPLEKDKQRLALQRAEREAKQAEIKIRDLEYPKDFLETLKAHKMLFKGYTFDRHDSLALTFEAIFPLEDIKMHLINCSSMKWASDLLTLYFKFNFDSDQKDAYSNDADKQSYVNNICSILGIAPKIEDRESARKLEKERISSINSYFDLCYSSNLPVDFTNIMTGQSLTIAHPTIFNNLVFVENQGIGFYRLHYNNGTKKCIFYTDGNENVKGHSNSGYSFKTVEEKNQFYKTRFKNKELLQNKFLVIYQEHRFYFWYLMREKYKILFSITPNYSEAFQLNELNYIDMYDVYTLDRVRGKVSFPQCQMLS